MLPFQLSAKALEDLKSIGRYTEKKWGRRQRNKYLLRLDTCFHMIAREPQIGVACDYIRQEYRKYPAGRHIIFYRQIASNVEIIRVLNDRMDVEKHLADR